MEHAAVTPTAFLAMPASPAGGLPARAPPSAPAGAGAAVSPSRSSTGLAALSPVLGTSLAAAALAAGGRRGARRAARVGRRLFAKDSPEAAAEKARLAEEEAEAKRFAEFCAARDALNLPSAVPFVGMPAYRDFMFNVPGDSGFDPLNLCKTPQDFEYQRRAELTHGRFAMLAAVGWPLSEIYQPALAKAWGMENELAAGGRAPSLLNGGLRLFDEDGPTVETFFFAAVVGIAYIVENNYEKTFDPLGVKGFSPPVLSGFLPEGREWMGEAELQHGRTAMIAITAYVIEEVASRKPVVLETPFLFGGQL